jgi:hypothetical protein
VTIDEHIRDVAGLAGFLLALAAFFANAQEGALRELRASPRPTREAATRQLVVDAALAAATLLAFLAGLPLWLEAVRHLHPLAASGGARSIFVLAWLLVLALVAWQLALVWRVAALRRRIPPD